MNKSSGMPAAKNSTGEKTRKRKSAFGPSEASAMLYWMQLGEVESWGDLGGPIFRTFVEAFGAHHPQWLVRSNPFGAIRGDNFRVLRQNVLHLTRAQCAAYLRVIPKTIERWETNRAPIPFAAFEALRLQSESPFFRLSSHIWDGWYIDCDGAFFNPKSKRLAFTPEELEQVPEIHGELIWARSIRDQLLARIDQLEAENASLRAGVKVKAVATELAGMQERIGELLSNLRTADIVSFPAQQDTHPTRKAAR